MGKQVVSVPGLSAEVSTLVDLARQRALDEPQRRAYSFLEFRARAEPSASHMTYEQLDARASAIAAELRCVARQGDRVLLLYRPGLDFVSGFLGCLYAGVVAVPTVVPRYGRGMDRLQGMMEDAEAAVILSTTSVKQNVEKLFADDTESKWICSDELDVESAAGWQPPVVQASDLAFLQYSSGSTGHPKGIVVSHENLMRQSKAFYESTGATRNSCLVSWLPSFHDLGLIGGILQPLYGGYTGVLMSPEAFLASPERWLETIAEYRADLSMAPNFAYQMCVERVAPEVIDTLDLSCWRFALNGAEPVRAGTIDVFARTFAKTGFRRESFFPAYGLAEATLMVTGGYTGDGPTVRAFNTTALEENKVIGVDQGDESGRTLVGCGTPIPDHSVIIADPVTNRRLGDSTVGEIWVSGPSVAGGYWQLGEESSEVFEASCSTTGEGPYLRTGDLGFVHDGELFICGRLKDLIIIRGNNHHAPDIELTVEEAHPALRASCGAAFSVDVDQEEQLVVVHEIDRASKLKSQAELDEVIAVVRQAISETHEVQVHSVVLLRHGSIPKTSSGKIQRRACRARYLEGRLKVRAAWSASAIPRKEASEGPQEERSESARELEQWFIGEIAQRIDRDPSTIDPRVPMAEFNLGSEDLMGLSRLTETRVGTPLPTTLFKDAPSIQVLADQLAAAVLEAKGAPAAPLEERALWVPSAPTSEPIALVGIGCRFPGAKGPREFWELLKNGVDAVTEVPAERWDIDGVYDPNPLAVGKMNTRCGGFLKDIDRLDSDFFALSIREAVRMDPQHRLMLESSWEALEDAGVDPDELAGAPVGVYVGISGSDYAQGQFSDPSLVDAYAGLGCALTIAASRVSYYFNFRGPAIAVDTACSSSLSAVHMACSSIWRGECEMALAGGVNILLAPTVTMCLTKSGMMAPDGRCKAFDARANGYVRSEGAGIVVLKPLSQALENGDSIYAVIRGSASNQDGRSSGIAAPNGDAQQDVVMSACRHAGISPGQLDYVEAHGTGTALGDPIEVNALGEVLAMERPEDTYCAIGSVKTNMGHAESAAGVASLIKAALVLKHRQIPPSLHFEDPNPLIPFDDLPIRVQTELGPLPERVRPALAGVNGFGVGGTNVHLILEEAPPVLPDDEQNALGELEPARPFVLPLSARSAASLDAGAQAVVDLLRTPEAPELLPDLCYTASRRRGQLEHRLTATGATAPELADALAGYLEHKHHPAVSRGVVAGQQGRAPKLAFVFSGQGSQWWGMGRRLLHTEPTFRLAIEECDALLRPHTGWSLMDQFTVEESKSRLDQTEYVQPALFALQVGVAALWRSWGVTPDLMTGHSVGEVAAAHLSGALTLSDATRLIAHRGRLMQEATGLGKMASVELSPEDLEPVLEGWTDRLAMAAVNSPRSVVLSGEATALTQVIEELEARGVVTVKLPVNYAFHSPQMEPFAAQLETCLEGLEPSSPTIPMVSTVTGGLCADDLRLDGRYWGNNVRRPVRLASAVEALADHGAEIFMEIGPHPVISGALSRNLRSIGAKGTVIQSLHREVDEQVALLTAFGMLHTSGRPGEWHKLYPQGRVCRSLPTYQWDRKRYWLDTTSKKAKRQASHPLLGSRLPVAQPVWQNEIDPEALPFSRDLSVKSRAVLPSGFLTEVALGAASEAALAHELADLTFHEAAELAGGDDFPVVQVSITEEADGENVIQVFTERQEPENDATDWQLHLSARTVETKALDPQPLALEELQGQCDRTLDGAGLYRKLKDIGADYGESLQVVEQAWMGEGQALVRIRIPESLSSMIERYRVHPVVLEAAGLAGRVAAGDDAGWLELMRFDRVRVLRPMEPVAYAYGRLRPASAQDAELVSGDIWVTDESGEVLALIEGAHLGRSRYESELQVPKDPEDWLYDIQWEEMPPARPGSSRKQGSWLVFSDQAGSGAELATQLRSRGERCVVVSHGVEFVQQTPESFEISAARLGDFERLLAEAFPAGEPACRGIVHMWSTDAAPVEATSAASIAEDQTLCCISVVHLLQALGSAGFSRAPQLSLVTRGAQPVAPDAPPVSVAQATVWGLGKVVAIEHPELRCRRVDLEAAGSPDEMSWLLEEILSDEVEDQVALRGEERYSARLMPYVLPSSVASEQAEAPEQVEAPEQTELPIPQDRLFRVGLAEPGEPDSLTVARASRRAPAAGEVEIRIAAAGLDAVDLTRLSEATGTDEKTAWISRECAGQVVRLGPEVTDLQVGDEVVALASGCLTPYLTLKASSVVAKPAALSWGEAATSLRASVAALYALREIAGLSEGDRILIHAAGGSVGLAAVQIAQGLGATVFATADNDQERKSLERMGVSHVFDAHSSRFLSQVMELTGGQGIEVVLNCMAGWTIADCLPVLRPFGRCIDAAKSQSGLGANTSRLQFINDISFHAVDVDHLRAARPSYVHGLLTEAAARFAPAGLRAQPVRSFAIGHAADALRGLMSEASSRVALSLPRPDAAVEEAQAIVREDGSYLITGGLGGLGLGIATRLVERGARHLVLVGRSAPSAEARQVLDRLRERGVESLVASVDVSDEAQVLDLLGTIEESMPPLRGVIHAAGVLNNSLLVQFDEAQFRSVLPAKVDGSWHLHTGTAQAPLDFFVVFSSLASLIGSPGQGNYAAANAFLDGLTAHRQAMDLPALSICWGPWDEIGMAADAHNARRLRGLGMGMLHPESAMDLLERLIEESRGVVGAISMNWTTWGQHHPTSADTPYFSHLVSDTRERHQGPASGMLTAEVLEELDPESRIERLEESIHQVICQALQIDPENLTKDVSLSAIGLDSIVALEIKSRLESCIDLVVQAPSLLKGPSIHQLAEQFLEMLCEQATDASSAADDRGESQATEAIEADADVLEAESLLEQLGELSDEEVSSALVRMALTEA